MKRLLPLQQVGLGYVKMGQSSSTLSGGENQRIKLAYFLSQEKQRPSMFIFDEPTTGLHFHDINTLMASFNRLIEKGHTIIIIEHNLDVVKCADHVIDMGPEGGNGGGHIVCAGTPEDIAACPDSYTGRFLKENLNNLFLALLLQQIADFSEQLLFLAWSRRCGRLLLLLRISLPISLTNKKSTRQ